MCGINGFNYKNDLQMKKMNKAIEHRGPDDTGVYSDSHVTLGHQRLSIIDLSPAGHQPMSYTHNKRKAIIVFNGEVYNFQEIKNQLIEKGYKFNSKSDTEVILASYFEWGYDCIKRFNGMWSFVIYDLRDQTLFCSRDRLGKKPFYYFHSENTFMFSSELKGIVAAKPDIAKKENIDPDALSLYFSLGYIPAPYSIYKNIRKLEARQNLVFDLKEKSIKKWYYYELPEYKPIYDKKKLIEEGRNLLKDAVRLRMVSDVPVGAFLSGGLDSSSIVAEMANFTNLKNLHTFSIGFEGKYDETKYIDIVRKYLGTIHHHTYFTEKDFEKLNDTIAWINDEPHGDPSAFPSYMVNNMAKKYATVVLSGDGGDEIFGGYPIFVIAKRLDLIRKLPKWFRNICSNVPVKKNLNSSFSLYALRNAFKKSLTPSEHFYATSTENDVFLPDIYKKWTIEKLKYCYKKAGGLSTEALRIYDLLFNTVSDNYLAKTDRTSMANTIEVRSPFLDYRFIEYSQKIPTEWKVDLSKTKKLMREIIQGIVPKDILKRGKQGFVPPLEKWIYNEKYTAKMKHVLKFITEIDYALASFLDEKVLKEHNTVYSVYRIRLFLFSAWLDRWISV